MSFRWPVVNVRQQEIPAAKKAGGFLENRGDRVHCGVDIYAPKGSDVIAMAPGRVLSVDLFTSPKQVSYWNATYQVIIQHDLDLYCRYAELHDVVVHHDTRVAAGELIGHVGQVLNPDKIDTQSPRYIQRLAKNTNLSMLHFEIYRSKPKNTPSYLGGNWFATDLPPGLIDPTSILKNATRN